MSLFAKLGIVLAILGLVIADIPSSFTDDGDELWYEPDFYNVDLESEIKYLNAQVEILWPREREVFEKFLPAEARDPNSNLIFADIGCGPGQASFQILEAC